MTSHKPSDAAPALEPGFHVYHGTAHNSGPYKTSQDAQSFIDGHLEGKGTIKEVGDEDNDND